MKNYLFLILIGAFFLSSCRKDHSKTNDSSGQKFAVNFTVGDLGKVATNSSKLQTNSVADTFKKYVKTLSYLVYSNDGLIHRINQDSTTTNLGNISDFFSPGSYTVIFVGNAVVNTGLGLSNDYFDVASLPDVFYQKLNITVTNAGINQQVSLDRVTSQVQIQATDVISPYVDSIKVSFNYDYAGLYVSNLSRYTEFTRVISHTFKPAERGSANYKISTRFFNLTKPFTVAIYRFPRSIFVSPIVINNVTCQSNKITLLTGKMFTSDVVSTGFNISFDPTWNSHISNF
ncbi:hypothetical protein G7092_13505 [Mucilaginibacter sp. HC2]|uniref:hypothetical protein n=1 Tax=Mucilaginibacter inviolabilis TaxID=2714892 RepID=UPI00140CDA3A|nr:hypothetical protein [Mucilaginibacter inviolabilis]NHA04821.1 hypothetical protein [Mucilaginibacter inviolabilis]